jgi:hypothetical protein
MSFLNRFSRTTNGNGHARVHVPSIEVEPDPPSKQIVLAPQVVPGETFGRLLRVRETIEELELLRQFVRDALSEGDDYGTIEGCNRPCLFQPGAQKIARLYLCRKRCRIKYRELAGNHLEVRVKAQLVFRETNRVAAEGYGSCSTREKKYRVRSSRLNCPDCGGELRRSKNIMGGFYCWAKKGGCGSEFPAHDERITSQPVGTTENADIDDCRNTVLKMAVKRALVAAALDLGCVGDLFTQDLEDGVDVGEMPPVIEPDRTPDARPVRKRPTSPATPSPAAPKRAPKPAPVTPPGPPPRFPDRPAAAADETAPGSDFGPDVELPDWWGVKRSHADDFWVWLCDRNREHPGLQKQVTKHAETMAFPVAPLTWDRAQVARAYRWAVREIDRRGRDGGPPK